MNFIASFSLCSPNAIKNISNYTVKTEFNFSPLTHNRKLPIALPLSLPNALFSVQLTFTRRTNGCCRKPSEPEMLLTVPPPPPIKMYDHYSPLYFLFSPLCLLRLDAEKQKTTQNG
jgi:hypothetical protein